MHLRSYLQSAAAILQVYDGVVPFASWLKTYFGRHKKFGGRDRKVIADLCFCYYRLGNAFSDLTVEERLLIAQFLCRSENAFINEYKPEWKEQQPFAVEEKIHFLSRDTPAIFFPLLDEVSGEIEAANFNRSLLVQPDLFLRIRPGKEKTVTEKLEKAHIHFLLDGHFVTVPNSTKIDTVLSIDSEAVIQDSSTQQVLDELFQNMQAASFQSWDCCAASGGKTILLHDHFPKARLTVSDIRQSILHNLKSRFRRAGISSYQSFVADVSSPQFVCNKKYAVIICDAPCSGSGTWGRTPEQLVFFKKDEIQRYAALQKAIAVNATACLKPGGYFVYITCSVFSRENEDVVQYLQKERGLKLLSHQYIKGYQKKADTLFTALFTTS